MRRWRGRGAWLTQLALVMAVEAGGVREAGWMETVAADALQVMVVGVAAMAAGWEVVEVAVSGAVVQAVVAGVGS